jgi:hypothetical protein
METRARVKIRVQLTRDMDVSPCEPDNEIQRGHQVAQCECGRVASRFVGQDPWINCVCGVRFNSNHSWIGQVV